MIPQIPQQLQRNDFRFCLIKAKDKAPFEMNWQSTANYKFNDEKLLQHISQGGNYGIVCGFGNLLVVDFDSEIIQAEKMPQMPETFTVKTGSGRFHVYYIVDTPESMKRLKTDIQGKGKQVVAPGSTHPNGNQYSVFKDIPITTIGFDLIRKLFDVPQEHNNTQEIRVKDESRSATEYRHVCKLVKQGKTKDEVFSEMKAFTKWNESPNSYRELTYNKALKFVEMKSSIQLNTLDVKNVYQNVEQFYEDQPFYFDKKELFWFWNNEIYAWQMVDEVDLLNAISDRLKIAGLIVTNGLKGQYIESFKQIGRRNAPIEPPKHWIQFKDKIFDIKTKQMFGVSPDYFFCNPIRWEIGTSSEVSIIDKLFSEWVGEEQKKTLYEIIAYCCLADYPIHLVFCLMGAGRNGKSKFLQLITKFLGVENTVSTELDALMDSRFESAKLYKKLACMMGETNFGLLEKTSLLKKLCGQDLIGMEFKNKMPFDAYNYAKILIASNSLPTSTDTSEGFYRRWFIIDFPNEFEEGKDILETITDEEYSNLANKMIEILPKLITDGKFSLMGSIEARKQRYVMASNPLPYFIEHFCDSDTALYVLYADLYSAYSKFLRVNKKRVVSYKEFKNALMQEGLDPRKTNHGDMVGLYVHGIGLKSIVSENHYQIVMNVTNVTNVTTFPTFTESRATELKNKHNSYKSYKDGLKIFLPCRFCLLNPIDGNYQDDQGNPICEICLESPLTSS